MNWKSAGSSSGADTVAQGLSGALCLSALPSVVGGGYCSASRSKEAARALLSHLHSTRHQEEGRKCRGKRALCLFHLIRESNLPTTLLYISLVNTGSYASVRRVPGMRLCGWLRPMRIHTPSPRAGHTATQTNWESVEKEDRAMLSFWGSWVVLEQQWVEEVKPILLRG